jgi:PHP family Zn ribbon phosphoesterase
MAGGEESRAKIGLNKKSKPDNSIPKIITIETIIIDEIRPMITPLFLPRTASMPEIMNSMKKAKDISELIRNHLESVTAEVYDKASRNIDRAIYCSKYRKAIVPE